MMEADSDDWIEELSDYLRDYLSVCVRATVTCRRHVKRRKSSESS